MAAADFGTVLVGWESEELYVSVLNDGPGAFRPAGVTSTSPNFRVTGGTCRRGVVVPAGGSCTVYLVFNADRAGRVRRRADRLRSWVTIRSRSRRRCAASVASRHSRPTHRDSTCTPASSTASVTAARSTSGTFRSSRRRSRRSGSAATTRTTSSSSGRAVRTVPSIPTPVAVSRSSSDRGRRDAGVRSCCSRPRPASTRRRSCRAKRRTRRRSGSRHRRSRWVVCSASAGRDSRRTAASSCASPTASARSRSPRPTRAACSSSRSRSPSPKAPVSVC